MSPLFRRSTINEQKELYPKTPKITSVGLPPNSPTTSGFASPTATANTFTMPRNDMTAHAHRSTTPHKSSGRRHTIPMDNIHNHHRSRTNSTSSHYSPDKPLKGILKNPSSRGDSPGETNSITKSSGRPYGEIPFESSHRERKSSDSGSFFKPLKSILKKTTPKTDGWLPPPVPIPISTTRSSSGRDYSMSDTEGYTRRSDIRTSSKHKPYDDYPMKDNHSKPLSRSGSKHGGSGSPPDDKIISRKGWETPDIKKMRNSAYQYSHTPSKTTHISLEPLKSPVISLHWVLVNRERAKKRPPECLRLSRVFDMAYQPDSHPYDPTGSYKAGALMHDSYTRTFKEDPPEFRDPASPHCVLREMRLVMASNPEWRTVVYARSGNTIGIRPIDIFRAIFDMLQAPLTQRELGYISNNPESLRNCERFRDERIRTSPILPEVAFAKGCLRIDLLGNRRYFNGLVQNGGEWLVEHCHPKDA